MARRKSLIGIAVLIAALGVMFAALAARGNGLPAVGVKTPPKPPASTTYDQGEWTIVTPAGWTHQNVTSKADARKAVRYNGPNGEYFIVAIDPRGSDYTYDALWTYAVDGNGFKVVDKRDCKGSSDQACSSADGRYDGYMMWRTGTAPVKVAGHVWYFMFGNAKAVTIDAGAFERIAESIRVR
jgi:hypothetical protein